MKSLVLEVKQIKLPEWRGDQLYMHPIDLGQPRSMPGGLSRWEPVLDSILEASPIKEGTAYITIDEKEIICGNTHRRGGPHTDGNYLFGWGGGGGWNTGENGRFLPEDKHKAQYCSDKGGMLIASSHTGCKAWTGEYDGEPNQGGNCDHLRSEMEKMTSFLLEPFKLYWMNSTAIHESMPMPFTTKRSLIRVTLPANSSAL